MIQKSYIVEQAMLKVGQISYYNKSASEQYKFALKLLDGIVRSTCKNNKFNFTSITAELTLNGIDKATGEYRYNRPAGFLGVQKTVQGIAPVSFRVERIKDMVYSHEVDNFRVQGEYIYSMKRNLTINYVRLLELSNFPEYMEEYMILALAKEIAQTNVAYNDMLATLNQQLKQEETNVELQEGFSPINKKGGNYL